MRQTLQKLGKNTSKAEVLSISANGIWILANEKEFFLPHKHYPWFRKARVSEIYNVRLPSTQHLWWPDLDVDLEIQSLENPDKYPLIFK